MAETRRHRICVRAPSERTSVNIQGILQPPVAENANKMSRLSELKKTIILAGHTFGFFFFLPIALFVELASTLDVGLDV